MPERSLTNGSADWTTVALLGEEQKPPEPLLAFSIAVPKEGLAQPRAGLGEQAEQAAGALPIPRHRG